MDSSGVVLATDTNFTESEPLFKSRSSKNSELFCVALSLAYEFKEQMPCSNPLSPGCQWSFIRYAPANCNNFHGTICQHENYDERKRFANKCFHEIKSVLLPKHFYCITGNITWFSKFKMDLTDVLNQTALTTEFGFKDNVLIQRSKYKVCFKIFLKKTKTIIKVVLNYISANIWNVLLSKKLPYGAFSK